MKRNCFFIVFLLASPLHAQAPSYARDIRPILIKYCSECHNSRSQKGGLDLSSHKAMLAGGDQGPVLIAGMADRSKLVTLMEGNEKPVMPPPRITVRPTRAEIERVRQWVRSGATDDSNAIKVAIPRIQPRKPFAAPVIGLAFLPVPNHVDPLVIARGNRLQRASSVGDSLVLHDPLTAVFADGLRIGAVATGRPGRQAEVRLFTWGPDQLRILGEPGLKHDDTILDVSISPNGEQIATASYDTRIQIARLIKNGSGETSFDQTATFKDHSDAVYAVAFRPDGKLLASCAADRTVKVWDVASRKLLFTLSESTDWLLTLAWSPDGAKLAAAGVDKSLRVYQITPQGGKIVQSVFAHEGPVLKLAYSGDGALLYSLGQDRVVKAWDAVRMVERHVFETLGDDGLSLAVHPREPLVAVGRYDGKVQVFDARSGKSRTLIDLPPVKAPGQTSEGSTRAIAVHEDVDNENTSLIKEEAGNDSPARGQLIPTSAVVLGQLDRAGDADFFKIQVAKGQPLGLHILKEGKTTRLEPDLQILDARGRIVAESARGFLGHTFAEPGTYTIGVRDRELRGGADFTYRLRVGEIPIVTSFFPLGGRRGDDLEVALHGVFLEQNKVRVKIPMDATVGSKAPVPFKGPPPLGNPVLVVGDLVESADMSQPAPIPGTVNGRLTTRGRADVWTFHAKKGERILLEVSARRIGSNLDSILEILNAQDEPLPRAMLRSQAKTYVTFRDHDSVTPNIRLEHWSELAVNDLLYVGGELVKIKNLPPHPDADCSFFSARGQRLAYLDTTPIHHANNVPMYKVSVHPPGTTFPPNGFPVFTIYNRNDDGGPALGRDSRLFFDPPADGIFKVRVSDARGQGGDGYGYRLTLRQPQPGFNVSFSPTAPSLARGDGVPLTVTLDRVDGYQGPVNLRFETLPPGLNVPSTTIGPEDTSTAVTLFADADAKLPEKPANLTLIGETTIGGVKVRRTFAGLAPKLIDSADVRTWTEEKRILIRPGGETKVTVHIERSNGFSGRVPIEVRGLPHGVKVLDVGLNGILITERETSRVVTLYAEPWVEAMTHPIVVLAKREGKNTEHAAKSVALEVLGK